MKKVILVAACALFAGNAFCSVIINYTSKDAKSQKMNVTIDGNKQIIEFAANTTSPAIMQGTATECTIETSCGKVKVKDGAKIEVKDGCIKIVK